MLRGSSARKRQGSLVDNVDNVDNVDKLSCYPQNKHNRRYQNVYLPEWIQCYPQNYQQEHSFCV